jgi:hypothetical protein
VLTPCHDQVLHNIRSENTLADPRDLKRYARMSIDASAAAMAQALMARSIRARWNSAQMTAS